MSARRSASAGSGLRAADEQSAAERQQSGPGRSGFEGWEPSFPGGGSAQSGPGRSGFDWSFGGGAAGPGRNGEGWEPSFPGGGSAQCGPARIAGDDGHTSVDFAVGRRPNSDRWSEGDSPSGWERGHLALVEGWKPSFPGRCPRSRRSSGTRCCGDAAGAACGSRGTA